MLLLTPSMVYAWRAVILPLLHSAITSSQLFGLITLGLPRCFPFALAASIPSLCLFLMVSLSCSAMVPRTSIKILLTISNTHSCPSGNSIIVVGRSITFNRILLSLKYCNSFLMSVLFLDNYVRNSSCTSSYSHHLLHHHSKLYLCNERRLLSFAQGILRTLLFHQILFCFPVSVPFRRTCTLTFLLLS